MDKQFFLNYWKRGFTDRMDIDENKHLVKLYREGRLVKEFSERTYNILVSQGPGKVEIFPIPDKVDRKLNATLIALPVVNIQGERRVKVIYDKTGIMHLNKINYRIVPYKYL